MEVRYLDSAREESFAAADYYEQQAKGLGADFLAVLDVHDDHLLIVAVAHQRRNPDYWRRRRTDPS